MLKTTEAEIDRAVRQVLRDAGIDDPPVAIEDILEHLELHRGFYDLENPSILARFWHRIRVEGRILVKTIRKIKLHAVWLPDETAILVDSSLPPPKQEWASFHDSVHRILSWHRHFFLGDTARTLDPAYQEQLETEANYGASALMFCGPVFTTEARDTDPCWSTVQGMAKRYDKSLVTTLRRYVEHGPDDSMAMLVSTASWQEKPKDQKERWRHFVPSPTFAEQFRLVTPGALVAAVDAKSRQQRGGIVAKFTLAIRDDNGTAHEFFVESFFNRYYVLSLFVCLGQFTGSTIAIAKDIASF